MAVLVASSDYGSSTFAEPTAGYLYSAGNYWETHKIFAPEYKIQEIEAPGVDGVAVKRHGFRGRRIIFTGALVATSESGVMDHHNTHIINLSDVKCSVSIPGDNSYDNCELVGVVPRDNPKPSGDGITYFMIVDFEFNQKRLS